MSREIEPAEKLVFILKIRKSNTKNDLWLCDEGKKFISKARSGVKKSKVVNDKDFYTVYEILD